MNRYFFFGFLSTIKALVCGVNSILAGTFNDISILEVVKSTFLSHESFVCMVAGFSVIKRTYILIIEIVLNFLLKQLEKFDRLLVQLIYTRLFFFQSIAPTYTYRICPKNPSGVYEMKKSFIGFLKSLECFKAFCIVIILVFFHTRMKYFNIRFQMMVQKDSILPR